MFACAGMFYKHLLDCFVACYSFTHNYIFNIHYIHTHWNNSFEFGPIVNSQKQASECVHM